VERGPVKITVADPDSIVPVHIWAAIGYRDYLQRVGASASRSFDDDFADSYRLPTVLDPTKAHSRRRRAVAAAWDGWSSTDQWTISSRDRASRLPCAAARFVPGHRLHETIRYCRAAQFLVPRYPSEATRRTQLRTAPDQAPEVPDRPFPAGRAHGPSGTRRPVRTTSPTRGTAVRGRGGPPIAAFAASVSTSAVTNVGFALKASPTTTARPDQFFVSQTSGRAAPHRRRHSSSS